MLSPGEFFYLLLAKQNGTAPANANARPWGVPLVGETNASKPAHLCDEQPLVARVHVIVWARPIRRRLGTTIAHRLCCAASRSAVPPWAEC